MAALCLELCAQPQDQRAGQVLEQYLAVYTHHYLQAKNQMPVQWDSSEHQQLQAALQLASAADSAIAKGVGGQALDNNLHNTNLS